MRFRKRMGELLEMPVEVTSELPKITMSGFDEVVIENFVRNFGIRRIFCKSKNTELEM